MRSFIVLGFVNSFGWVWIGVSFTLLLHLIHFISILLYLGYFVCIVYCSGVSYIYTILHWISHLLGVVLHRVWLYCVVYSYWFGFHCCVLVFGWIPSLWESIQVWWITRDWLHIQDLDCGHYIWIGKFIGGELLLREVHWSWGAHLHWSAHLD